MTNETALDGVVPPYRAPEHEVDLVGVVVGGRYRIRRKLGQGGMGAVYAAEQEPLGREVALKIVRGELANQARHLERFRREAKTLSQLVHPHIVALYDFGEAEQGTLYFAMELLPGESLRQRLHASGRMAAAATVPIIREMCSALGAAHALGVLHRDLKPDNVMLIEAFGRKDFVKLLDFGIAKVVSEGEAQSLTQSGTLVGTPGYVAREVAVDGVHDDKRSDLYAVGVTWFEMLTGRAPFSAQTAVGLIMKHANEAPPRIADLVPDVPTPIAALVDQLLAKDPARRPASADALIARLDALALAGATYSTDSFVQLRPTESAPQGTAPFLDAIPPTMPTAIPQQNAVELDVHAPDRRPRVALALALVVVAVLAFAFGVRSRIESAAPHVEGARVETVDTDRAHVVEGAHEQGADVEGARVVEGPQAASAQAEDARVVTVKPRPKAKVKPKLIEAKEPPKLID